MFPSCSFAAVPVAAPPTSASLLSLLFVWKSVDPDFYSKNLLMLGKTYLAMKDKDKALLWLAKAKDYPGRTLEDKEVQQQQHRFSLSAWLQRSSKVVSVLTVPLSLQQVQKEAADLLKKLWWSYG